MDLGLNSQKNDLREKSENRKHDTPTIPKANAAISSSEGAETLDDDDFVSFGTCRKPHKL